MIPILEQCAPAVHPVTMSAVVMHESGGNPLAIHNNKTKQSYKPKTLTEAVALADGMIKRGESVDLGLAQINSVNLRWLGLTVQTVFDPCKNLTASQAVLLTGWKRSGGDLKKTLSAYNTGKIDSSIGLRYADAVYKKAGVVIPAISVTPLSQNESVAAEYKPSPSAKPVKVKLEWMPAASPFAVSGDGLNPHW